MRDNTLIIFASDNGGATSACSRPVRGRRKSARKAGRELGAKPPASNGDFAVARVRSTRAACGFRLSSTGRRN